MEKNHRIRALPSFPRKTKNKVAEQWAETFKKFACDNQKASRPAVLAGWQWLWGVLTLALPEMGALQSPPVP